MKDIKQLEAEARLLEPNQAEQDHLNHQMIQYASHFLNALPEKKAYQQDYDPSLEIVEYGFSEKGRPVEEVLEILNRTVDNTGINPASGKHFGYIPGGGLTPTAMGDFLGAITNRYAGMFFANPGAVRMENLILRWLCQLIGYPESAMGNLSSGGSLANLIAITTARDKMGIQGADIAHCTVYLTEHVHHCIQKALRIAGMREVTIRYIPIDDRFRMKADVLQKQLEMDVQEGYRPFLLVGSAGTTNTGAIDPLDEMASLAEQFNLWFHVDAAYGGAFLLVDDLRTSFKGIERSDSVTLDPHKGFFLSYGTGAILVKEPDALFQSQFYSANYMQDAYEVNHDWSPSDLSPELTKHFRGLRMWLPLQLFGIRPFRAALEEKVWLTQYFYEKIQEYGFEVGPYPQLSVLLFRFVPDGMDINAFNQELVHWLQQDGTFFFSTTTIKDQFYIRLAVLSFRTHLKEIEESIQLLQKGVETVQVRFQETTKT